MISMILATGRDYSIGKSNQLLLTKHQSYQLTIGKIVTHLNKI